MADHVIGHADVTASWINTLFGSRGIKAKVAAISAEAIGTGQVGSTFRYNLTYEVGASEAPSSVIGKFHSDNPESREAGKTTLTYLREAGFYQQFASRERLPVPEMLHLEFNEDSHEFALIMTDFPHHYPGNQLAMPTVREAELAVDAAAAIHSAWWQDPVLDRQSWMNGAHAAVPPFSIDELYASLWPAFCDRYADRVSDAARQVGNAYVGQIATWQAHLAKAPRCLVHNDFRPDNMLFAPDDPVQPVVIVDWQTTGVGCGATDIAYYIGTSFDPDHRAEIESTLLQRYLSGLSQKAIVRSDIVALEACFGLSSFAGFLMGVTASMIVQRTNRGDAMFLTMCERSAAMTISHGICDW